jgi:hypothetical protein
MNKTISPTFKPHDYFKLTDQDGYTRRGTSGETLWLPLGTKIKPLGKGSEPCGPGVLHLYQSEIEAVLYNPLHANIQSPRLFCVRPLGKQKIDTDGLKCWTGGRVQTVEEVVIPSITQEQIIAWSIVVSPHRSTREWAVDWLSGKDRSARAAEAAWAARAAWAAARAAEAARAAVDFHAYSLAAYSRAEQILAGTYPAEEYDAPLIEVAS